MIANITKGSNFGGLLRYLLHESKQPQIVAPYMLGDNASDLAREFNEIAKMRPTTKLPLGISRYLLRLKMTARFPS